MIYYNTSYCKDNPEFSSQDYPDPHQAYPDIGPDYPDLHQAYPDISQQYTDLTQDYHDKIDHKIRNNLEDNLICLILFVNNLLFVNGIIAETWLQRYKYYNFQNFLSFIHIVQRIEPTST